MTLHALTPWVMLAIGVLAIGYDVFAMVRGGTQATISRVTLAAWQRAPAILLTALWVIGLLCGHLFWPQILGPGGACP